MMTTEIMQSTEQSDAELVARSLIGNTEAFRAVVERHKTLICSLAYSATGSLPQSEDLAQETFVAAWRELPNLREPAKLRPWLCGIARNLIGKARRRDAREPVHAAETLDAVNETATSDAAPPDRAITAEETAILWRSLERIPETYREPLVLFYRERQSIERVADALGMSEDAVKQRLSRGRKLLQEEVRAFVEGTLERTNPGKGFTLAVLAALPACTYRASAAALGATAAKSGTLAKAFGWAGFAGPVLTVLGAYFGYRVDLDTARSAESRAFVKKFYRMLWAGVVVFSLALLGVVLLGWEPGASRPALMIGLVTGLGGAYVVFGTGLFLWSRRRGKSLQRQPTTQSVSPPTGATGAISTAPVFEYRSKAELLGWPLIHIRLRAGLERGPVKAWIAGGDAAVGLIFAFGALAIAPVSFGGIALGLVPVGGLALGLVALGGFSLAGWALGGFAIGWQAFGACALGWDAASGATAVAHSFAAGSIALAAQANNAAAQDHLRNSLFFQSAARIAPYLSWLNLFWLFPVVLWLRVTARTRRKG